MEESRVLITNDFYERNYNHNIMQNIPVDSSTLLGTEITVYDTWAEEVSLGSMPLNFSSFTLKTSFLYLSNRVGTMTSQSI